MLIDNLLSPILTDWILIEYPVERWKTQNSSYKCRGRIKEDTKGLRGTWLAAVFMPHNHPSKKIEEDCCQGDIDAKRLGIISELGYILPA